MSAILFSPVASVIPAEATVPSLVLVGLMMMTIARDIPWTSYEEAIPAFVTLLTPFSNSPPVKCASCIRCCCSLQLRSRCISAFPLPSNYDQL